MHLGLKRNFQVMPGAEWLELLLRHVPERYEHLVRYVGWYSNRARGERAKALKAQAPVLPAPAQFAARGNRRCESATLRTQGAACSTARGQSRAGRLPSAECVAVG